MLDEEAFREGKITVLDDFLQVDMGDVIGKTVGFTVPDGLRPGAESADCRNQPRLSGLFRRRL